MTQKSPSGHHRTTLSGYIFATKGCIDNRKKLVKRQYPLHGLGSVTARHPSSRCQPNFAALNRGRHLYSAWQPSPWALAHILVSQCSIARYNVAKLPLKCISEVDFPESSESKKGRRGAGQYRVPLTVICWGRSCAMKSCVKSDQNWNSDCDVLLFISCRPSITADAWSTSAWSALFTVSVLALLCRYKVGRKFRALGNNATFARDILAMVTIPLAVFCYTQSDL